MPPHPATTCCSSDACEGYCQGCLYLSLYDSFRAAEEVAVSSAAAQPSEDPPGYEVSSAPPASQDHQGHEGGSASPPPEDRSLSEEEGTGEVSVSSAPALPTKDPPRYGVGSASPPPGDRSPDPSEQGTEESWHTAPRSPELQERAPSPREEGLSAQKREDTSSHSQPQDPESPHPLERPSSFGPRREGGLHKTAWPFLSREDTPSLVGEEALSQVENDVSSLSGEVEVGQEEGPAADVKGKARERDTSKASKRQSVGDWYCMTPLTDPRQPNYLTPANNIAPHTAHHLHTQQSSPQWLALLPPPTPHQTPDPIEIPIPPGAKWQSNSAVDCVGDTTQSVNAVRARLGAVD
ncbi:hypothetical protein GGR57DRAFT_519784 [Xylariaceae sp. FL1272]|nr:hypothetical protein GGR57DRAFT_519784 [Xylariaceae sp. FL1272]